MSEAFIRTARGAVNLRYVRSIRERTDEKGRTTYTAVSEDGREVEVSMSATALDGLCQRVIPAAADDRACFLAADPDNLTAGAIWEQHVKIVGWAINTNYAGGSYGVEPIFTDAPASNQTPFIRSPDGSWLQPETQTFATLDEAKAEIVRWAIESRDRLAQAAAAEGGAIDDAAALNDG